MRAYFEKLLKTSQPQKQLPFIFPLLIALISGAIFSLALAPYYFWWLAILSPALLYAVLRQRNPRQAFALGWAYGFGLWFIGAFWLYTSIHTYGDTNAFLSILNTWSEREISVKNKVWRIRARISTLTLRSVKKGKRSFANKIPTTLSL